MGRHHGQSAVTMVNEPLFPQGNLNGIPYPRAGYVRRPEPGGLFGNRSQIGNQVGALTTGLPVRFLFNRLPAVNDLRQNFLKLFARHTSTLPDITLPLLYCVWAFAALLVLRRSRNFIRALCNWDLLFPIEHPTKVAISLCSYPSTSCSTKIVRYPGGSASTAR